MTSVSAKVDLVRRFRQALNSFGLKLVVTDISAFSPALYEADQAFLSEPDQSPRYLDVLIEHCHRHDIRVILPTRDAELPMLAQRREQLARSGIWVLVSPLATLECCQDKIAFHQWCQNNNLPVLPALNNPNSDDYPLFARSRHGSGGQGSHHLFCRDDLEYLVGDSREDWLIQPHCRLQEYTLDAVFDCDGQLTQWVARERIRIESGESKVSRTVHEPRLDSLLQTIANKLPFFGPVTVQTFLGAQEGPWLIEVNPRFGGACALGIEAGLDTPNRLVSLVQGDLKEFYRERPIRYGLTMLRYSSDLFVSDAAVEETQKGRRHE